MWERPVAQRYYFQRKLSKEDFVEEGEMQEGRKVRVEGYYS